MDNDVSVDVVCLNFAKAFNYVNHTFLLMAWVKMMLDHIPLDGKNLQAASDRGIGARDKNQGRESQSS